MMKVTNSIMEIASDAWDNVGSNDVDTCLKAALEAVFAMQEDVVKDFVDTMESEYKRSRSVTETYEPWEYFEKTINTLEYQALKASIGCQDNHIDTKRPLKEPEEKMVSLHGSKEYKEFQREKNATLTRIMEQIALNPKPAQDNDGWIEWSGGECPVSPSTMVIIKLRKGSVKGPCLSGSFVWTYGFPGMSNDIIAYRIIDDLKEESSARPLRESDYDGVFKVIETELKLKKGTKEESLPPIEKPGRLTMNKWLNDIAEPLADTLKREKKEPKKQTLRKYAEAYHLTDEQQFIIDLINEYLEQRK